jgi:hypothetical protein
VTFAHIGGVPVEETVPALVAAGWAVIAYTTARIGAWRRRR